MLACTTNFSHLTNFNTLPQSFYLFYVLVVNSDDVEWGLGDETGSSKPKMSCRGCLDIFLEQIIFLEQHVIFSIIYLYYLIY